MATSISSKPDGILLLSQIEDVSVETSEDVVIVELLSDDGRTLLSERYYPYDNLVTVCDIASLIANDMRSATVCLADFVLSIKDESGAVLDSWPFSVLYCDRHAPFVNVEQFLQENFLTTLRTRRVSGDFILPLMFVATEDESLLATVEYRYRRVGETGYSAGTMSFPAYRLTGNSVVCEANISCREIVEVICTEFSLNPYEVELLNFAVSVGHRSLMCFVDSSLSYEHAFVFRNCFNVPDVACLPVQQTAKTTVDKSTAVINGISLFYDETSSKNYEVEAGPLIADEAAWIDQLFCSHAVTQPIANPGDYEVPFTYVPVLITESTCEIHNHDDKLNTAKFTWRYVNNMPVVDITPTARMFKSPFNQKFN